MNIPFYSAADIQQHLSFGALVAHLREGHRQPAPAVDRILMLHRDAAGTENGFLIWPAWQHERNLGIKIVTIFPDNKTVPSVQAVYALFDGSNGAPVALIDGTEMTYWKTAADSTLGADYLARHDAKTLLMVGAGSLAPYLIRAYQSIRPGLERIQVWNRTAEKAKQVVKNIQNTPAELALDLETAVRTADIVCCATSGTHPLIRGEWLKSGAHLDLIGGYKENMREADDEAVRRASIFVDSRWFTITHVGDLSQPIASGVITANDVHADLFELCSGQHTGRRSATEITLFKCGGGAHLDLMTAQHIQAVMAAQK